MDLGEQSEGGGESGSQTGGSQSDVSPAPTSLKKPIKGKENSLDGSCTLALFLLDGKEREPQS